MKKQQTEIKEASNNSISKHASQIDDWLKKIACGQKERSF